MTFAKRVTVSLVALTILASCSNGEARSSRPLIVSAGMMAVSSVAEARAKRSGKGAAAKAGPTRADLEKSGEPVLRAEIASLEIASFLSILDSRDDVETWTTKNEKTFSLRNGVLIQTRGLGPDLMSSNVPSVGQLLTNGGTHQRQYFFLGANDQPTRRSYDCTVTVVGTKEIKVFERKHQVTRVKEDCVRPQSGKISNDFWIEGRTVRKSRQWVSAFAGYIEFERVVD